MKSISHSSVQKDESYLTYVTRRRRKKTTWATSVRIRTERLHINHISWYNACHFRQGTKPKNRESGIIRPSLKTKRNRTRVSEETKCDIGDRTLSIVRDLFLAHMRDMELQRRFFTDLFYISHFMSIIMVMLVGIDHFVGQIYERLLSSSTCFNEQQKKFQCRV